MYSAVYVHTKFNFFIVWNQPLETKKNKRTSSFFPCCKCCYFILPFNTNKPFINRAIVAILEERYRVSQLLKMRIKLRYIVTSTSCVIFSYKIVRFVLVLYGKSKWVRWIKGNTYCGTSTTGLAEIKRVLQSHYSSQ